MKHLHPVVAIVILLVTVLAACAPREAAPATSPQSVAVPVKPARTGWEADWESVVAAARKEGVLSIYDQWGPQARIELNKAFKDKFGIDIEFTSVGKSSELVPKLDRERRAGLYLADVLGAGIVTILTEMKPAGILAPIESMLILPDAKDTRNWTGGRIFVDAGKLAVGLSSDFNSYVGRNTELVKDGEIKSYYDFLEPKWKGKIVLADPTVTGSGNGWVFTMAGLLGVDKTKDYLRQFVKQDPAIVRDLRLQVEGLARGKYALYAGVHAPTMNEFKNMGAPVDKLRVKEGGSGSAGSGSIAMPAGQLPHPNAARVFINWLLTKEGQTVFSKGYLRPSARLDVSTAGFEDSVPLAGEKVVVEDEDGIKLKGELLPVAREIFAPLMK
ncbi:MAG: extracellular solute-binding protein [Chloroflexi bacterium]|nr:extracellular solute-binding protein [Chloroflexota bacterium]